MNDCDYHIAPFGENGWIATDLGNQNVVDKALLANAIAKNIRSVNGIIDAVAGQVRRLKFPFVMAANMDPTLNHSVKN